MGTLITFNTPAMDKKKNLIVEERQGYVALLYVGNYQEKFVLQTERNGTDVQSLVHWASGYKLGDLNPIKVRHWRSYSTMTDREAAKQLLADVVSRIGADAVREKLASVPVINT